MIEKRVRLFLRNFLLFWIYRLGKEIMYICGKRRNYEEGDSERGDLYAKQVVENIIHDRARKCDPYMVDGTSKIAYGKTSIVLEPARVTGLSTLKRTNICILKDLGNRIFFEGTFGAGPLTYRRKIVFKYGSFNRKISVLASLINIKVSVDFSTEKETGRNGLLEDFTVNELNGFNLSINGLGYFDWTINLVLSFLTLFLGRIVRNLLENELENCIRHRLPKYQFPVEGVTYRNGTKFNIPPKDVQNNEAPLCKTFYRKQNCKRPKSSKVPPIAKKTKYDRKGYTNLGTMKSSRSSLLTDILETEVNSFCLPEQNLGECSGSLSKNFCSKVSKNKSEEDWKRCSALSRENKNITCSLNEVKEKLVSISNIVKSTYQGVTSQNRLKDACSLSNRNSPIELNDICEAESNSRESMVCATSSPPKSFELKDPQNISLLVCKELENTEEPKMEDSSKMLRDFSEDFVEMAFEGISERLNEISSKIRELSCEKNVDENAFDVGIELPISLADYDSSSSTKTELTQIGENVVAGKAKTFGAEGGTFLEIDTNRTPKMLEDQISEERSGRIEDSNERKVSVESCIHRQSRKIDCSASNLDLKLCNAEMIRNYLLNPCKDDPLAKDLKVYKDLGSEIETPIEDSESINFTEMQGVEMPEKRYISNPDDIVNGETHFKCDIISDSIEPVLAKDEKNLDTEKETEIISTILQFSEKHEDKVNEKIPFKYSESHIEDGKDTLNIAEGGYASEIQRDREMLNTSNFQNEDTACSNLQEKLECPSNENVSECTDCMVESSSVAGLSLNADSPKNRLAETPDQKLLNDLQKEIIDGTLKLKSIAKLESDSKDNEYPDSFPVCHKNLEFETEGLESGGVERLLQKYSEGSDSEVPCLLQENRPSLNATEISSETDNELASSEINELKDEMKFIEKSTDSLASELERT